MTKKCSKCGVEKLLTEYSPNSKTRDKRASSCKKCHQKLNKDNQYQKKWMEKNKDKWKDYYKKYRNNRRGLDKRFSLDSNMSSTISAALKAGRNWKKWTKFVGYNIDDLAKHLEGKFEPWMNWENYGTWEIDHIVPKTSFNYQKPEDVEFKECWALENLRPLEKSANRKKFSNQNQ